MKKKILAVLLCITMVGAFAAGCGKKAEKPTDTETMEVKEEVEVTLFAAKSLNQVMEELIKKYNETNPNVKIVGNYDSSGTLMSQIQEGASCDVFFSAAQKQMDKLEEAGLVVEGTRKNIVNNQVCVVTYKGSETKVKGLETLKDAKSFALADGSVPVGKYTRQAMIKAGMLQGEDPAEVTTAEVAEALGGVEINECGNVGAVRAAIEQQSNEVGTIYFSDLHGSEDKIEILEKVGYDLTGDVIYPAAQIVNKEAKPEQISAAKDFVEFLSSDVAKEIFDSYNFDTNVK